LWIDEGNQPEKNNLSRLPDFSRRSHFVSGRDSSLSGDTFWRDETVFSFVQRVDVAVASGVRVISDFPGQPSKVQRHFWENSATAHVIV